MLTQERKSIPGPGRTIYNEAEKRGKYVRLATQILHKGCISEKLSDCLTKSMGIQEDNKVSDLILRAAWFLVNQWLYVSFWCFNSKNMDFEDSERIFFSDDKLSNLSIAACFSDSAKEKSLDAIRSFSLNQDFQDLLPYILDPYGPGSRASVMRDPSTANTRKRKRKNGIFFTPEDVAEYMVEKTIRKSSDNRISKPTILDPACGTGVFLRAALRNLITYQGLPPDIALGLLYGTDICFQSIDNSAFVLMHALNGTKKEIPLYPVNIWRKIRSNFAIIDSCRLSIDKGKNGVKDDQFQKWKIKLGSIFPDMRFGANILVGNPPYNKLGKRNDRSFLKKHFKCLNKGNGSDSAETYLLFIEMMWKLTNQDYGCSALVVPMSLAYNTNTQFKLCRKNMEQQDGLWEMAFFDREPHALFGEDIKTRNAIVLYNKGKKRAGAKNTNIKVTGLKRWTSRGRDSLFKRLKYTDIKNIKIEEYIPKLGSIKELKSYIKIQEIPHRLSDYSVVFYSKKLEEISNVIKDPIVYVSGTAYNFLNIFRALGDNNLNRKEGFELSKSAIHAIYFASEEDARAGYALLSSRTAYWLWQIIGDGFHVTRKFLRNLPFCMERFSISEKKELAFLGQNVWLKCLERRKANVNRGRTTFAFRPILDSENLTRIDKILAKRMGLSDNHAELLSSFVHNLVVMKDAERLCLLK